MTLDAATHATGLRDLAPREAAVFLDFDGVLVDHASTPDAVVVPDSLISLLAVLESETDGACAIVTGRSLAELRHHLPLVPHAVIASHGAEEYLPGAPAFRHPMIGSDAVSRLQEKALSESSFDGVRVERKPAGVAFHYGAARDQETRLRNYAQTLVTQFDGFELIEGRTVIELGPSGIGKGAAVARGMALPVFAGRVPVFFGADISDEPALDRVARTGGVAVRVGPGDTLGRARLSGPAEVQAALADWLEKGWRAA